MPTPAQNMFSTDISRLTVAVSRLTQTLERGARGGGGVMAGALAGGLAGRVGGVMAGASAVAQVAATASPAAPGGLAAQAAATQQMARAVAQMGTASSSAAKASEEHAEKMKKQVVVFGLLSGAVLSWTRAGLAGTTAGERLSLNFQMISREIAQLFLPAIERVLHFMEDVIARFRELSGDQQNAIGRWIGIGAAVLGVVVILPKLVAGFQALKVVLTAMGMGNPFGAIITVLGLIVGSSEEARAAFGDLLKHFGRLASALGTALAPLLDVLGRQFAAWGKALVPVVQAVTTIVEKLTQGVQKMNELMGASGKADSGSGRSMFGNKPREPSLWMDLLFGRRVSRGGGDITAREFWLGGAGGDWMGQRAAQGSDDRNQLANARTSFEDVTATFRRIQESALRTDYQKETADNTRDIRQNVSEIARRMATGAAAGIQIREPPPPVGA